MTLVHDIVIANRLLL